MQEPPVPIPNTEVKLQSADNTWLATAREDRSWRTQVWYRRANPKVRFTSVQEPPVPIPNTEVKLQSAEDTRLATARENRPKRTFLLSSVGRAHDC